MFMCSAWSSRPTSAWINMFQHLCSMFLLSSPTSMSSMVTGRRVHQDTCPRFCHSPGGHATWYSLVHWDLSLTDYSGYLMPLHASSVECAVWPWTVAAATYRLALAWCGRLSPVQARHHSTGVCITRHQSTWQTAVSLSRMLLVVRDCTQHTIASWMYRTINERHLAVGRFLLLYQPFGICFQTS